VESGFAQVFVRLPALVQLVRRGSGSYSPLMRCVVISGVSLLSQLCFSLEAAKAAGLICGGYSYGKSES
jgi:hypothetical protein